MFKTILKNPDIQKRIGITLLVLIIYKIGIYITVPGIDKDLLKSFLGSSEAFNMTNLISGGALTQYSIFALGVMPYIMASIIIQLLSFDVVPRLTELRNQGAMGEKELKRITNYLAIGLAFVQGLAMSIAFNRFAEGFVKNDVWWSYLLITVILTLGTVILILFGKWIDNKGIGKGMSVIILGSILMSIPSIIMMQYESLDFSGDGAFIEIIKTILIVLLLLSLLVFIVFVFLSERRIPIKSSNNLQAQMRLGTEGIKNYLPFKLLAVGVIPVIFASSFIYLPGMIAQINPSSDWASFVVTYFSLSHWVGILIFAVIIFIFTYFYMFIQLNPEKIAENLSKSNSFIPGIRPGKDTEEYLKSTLIRICTISAFILSIVSILPTILTNTLNAPTLLQLGGISFIIMVSASLEMYSQLKLEKQKEETKLKGFIRK